MRSFFLFCPFPPLSHMLIPIVRRKLCQGKNIRSLEYIFRLTIFIKSLVHQSSCDYQTLDQIYCIKFISPGPFVSFSGEGLAYISFMQPSHTKNHGRSSHQPLAFLFVLFSEQFVEKSSCSQPLSDLPNLDTHGDFSSSDSPSSLCTEPLIPTTPVIPSEEMAKISCNLETKELWDKFHELGTEMIITKSGR